MSIMDESLGVGGVGWIYHIPFHQGSGISSFQSISLCLVLLFLAPSGAVQAERGADRWDIQ